jgi:hypothetical protein
MTAIVVFKQSAIKGLATLLTDKTVFNRVLDAVRTVDNPNTPNNEKRDAVVQQLETVGLGLVGWILNLTIELAVAYLRVGQP